MHRLMEARRVSEASPKTSLTYASGYQKSSRRDEIGGRAQRGVVVVEAPARGLTIAISPRICHNIGSACLNADLPKR